MLENQIATLDDTVTKNSSDKLFLSVIGLVGHKGSGKDTIANILIEYYGYTKLSFAAKLKDVVADLYGLDRKMLEGDTLANRLLRDEPIERLDYKSPRQILQLFGTEVGRQVYNNTWIDYLVRQIQPGNKYVISDCRFLNEAKVLRSIKNIFLLGVKRKATDPTFWQQITGHASEKEIPMIHDLYCDDVISNDGTIEDLENLLKFEIKGLNINV